MREAVDRFLGQGVEGIIVIASEMPALQALTGVAADVPLVAVGCGTRAPLRSVAIDNIAGAFQATRHLLDLGHETVHYVGGPDTTAGRPRARGRLGPARCRRRAHRTGATARRLVRALGLRDRAPARDLPEVTAVFCANDQMALGLLRALAECGPRASRPTSAWSDSTTSRRQPSSCRR